MGMTFVLLIILLWVLFSLLDELFCCGVAGEGFLLKRIPSTANC